MTLLTAKIVVCPLLFLYSFGGFATNALSNSWLPPMINKNVPALYQSYISPKADYLGNTVLGTTISSIPSFIDTPDKKK